MKKATSMSFIILALLLASTFVMEGRTSGSETTTLCLQPANVTVKYGETFTVYLNISNVADLKGFDIKLRYDTEVLDAIDSCADGFLNEPKIIIKNVIDEKVGTVWIAVASLAPEGVTGSGTLAHITFQSVLSGECLLDLCSTALADSYGNPIPHEKVNSHVVITGTTRLYIYPSEILVAVGEEFTVYVKLENVRRLYGIDIRFAFDTSILDLIDLELLPESLASHIASAWVWSAWSDPKTGSMTLASLTFKAKAGGNSPIHMYRHDLATLKGLEPLHDSVGWPISHSAEDGHCSAGPIAATQDLKLAIKSWGLDGGSERSLTSKLDEAIGLLDRGNTVGAIHKLQDLVKRVKSAEYLTQDQKNYLIDTTQKIISMIG